MAELKNFVLYSKSLTLRGNAPRQEFWLRSLWRRLVRGELVSRVLIVSGLKDLSSDGWEQKQPPGSSSSSRLRRMSSKERIPSAFPDRVITKNGTQK
ncbi:hypothetical protein TNCT_442821 [Trichonephila clavata]|uniref:Uncharacterized protein n=1 Tax=Trichonephila clavata TaxID=2740835 RepID=A0A8X6HJ04_TRICU|nr:hypothetical protein TNCT_442821 [Trichonephila clavata]